MEFKEVTAYLENVKCAKNIAEKSNVFKDLFKQFRKKIDPTLINEKIQQEGTFSLLRLVLPALDRDRPSYRIQKAKFAAIIIRMLCLQNNDKDKSLLLSCAETKFPDIAYTVLRRYFSNVTSQLTIDMLNTALDKLAHRKSDSIVEEILMDVFRKCSPQDIKWVICIILKRLFLGIDSNNILNCFHKDASSYYSTTSNLKLVCKTLWNPEFKLDKLNIQLFEAFQPMLSKRCDEETFLKIFKDDKAYFVENKFDGERFQVHIKTDGEKKVFKYFSRRGFDYTTQQDVLLSPFIEECLDNRVKNIILDGEMMLWNKKTNKFGTKGLEIDVKNLSSTGTFKPCFCIYDILFLNDEILTDIPLEKRLKKLRKAVTKTIPGSVQISDYTKVNTRQGILDCLNDSMNNEEEGIIVKLPESVYSFNDRNGGWFKVKMDFFEETVEDLDLLLIGACYGPNKLLTSFIVGIRSGDNKNRMFLSFAKIGSGLNCEELGILTERFKEHGHEFKDFQTKSKGKLSFGTETPDVFIEPENSFVFLVRATELLRINNTSFKTPYTLRFPRVLKIREDKPPEDCLSVEELLSLTNKNKSIIKLHKQHLKLSDLLKVKPKKKQIPQLVSTVKLTEKSNILDGLKFYIFVGTEKQNVISIENLIRQARGTVTINEEMSVDIVLVVEPDESDEKLRNFIRTRDNFNIIKIDWLYRILKKQKLLPFKQEEIINLKETHNFLSEQFDKYGDSYVEPTTKEKLKRTFDLMSLKGDFLNCNKKMKLKTSDVNQCTFNKATAYFDQYEIINNPTSKQIYDSEVDEFEFLNRNGSLSKFLTNDVNLVIIDNLTREDVVQDFLDSIGNTDCAIYSNEFLQD